jgi:hypothetical protein
MKTEAQILSRIEEIKKQINELELVCPGSLTMQPRSSGKSYLQLSYTFRGRGWTKYVSEKDREEVEQALSNYKQSKELLNEWIDLSIDVLALRKGKKNV